ncbi:hypothetical protein T4E_12298 [Trichinella pseudospiralis]|uniref:Uncharacterized protein n=1 Tax=Trichinella pseudospiralis TaxID=6337 RepID=A0A0V0Y7V9_TRIPS|nr:hypothetical protein T4E_12298 [Trichinella pseudospiralis]
MGCSIQDLCSIHVPIVSILSCFVHIVDMHVLWIVASVANDRFRSLFTHLSMQTNTAFLLLCFVLCVSLAHSASALSNSAQCMVNAIVTYV